MLYVVAITGKMTADAFGATNDGEVVKMSYRKKFF
jgi:hypothetical protein